jgi:hypothetical protein
MENNTVVKGVSDQRGTRDLGGEEKGETEAMKQNKPSPDSFFFFAAFFFLGGMVYTITAQ